MYKADDARYDGKMQYLRCGKSGILMPRVALGLWHNFGSVDDFENQINIIPGLKKIKEYYLKSKYLLRIRESLSTFALPKES